ncbi:hypothetical protein OBBRIDRAFT_798196 [Obba rivulosa]|uniref:Uncharacterized protein n=1 Tax=Obba rivulosa TaxID=1052685 RepID=A0A8E2DH29_9APHY|nr:hypothetical protein OBBRIDRAFT_798196 [Obba rivulosa]
MRIHQCLLPRCCPRHRKLLSSAPQTSQFARDNAINACRTGPARPPGALPVPRSASIVCAA